MTILSFKSKNFTVEATTIQKYKKITVNRSIMIRFIFSLVYYLEKFV